MTDLEKGDRVIATESLSTGFMSSVEKGTRGVIADVESYVFGSNTYEVHWEDGEKSSSVEGTSLAKLANDDSAEGCAMMMMGTLLLAAAWHRRR